MSESASKIFLEGDSDIKLNREQFNLMSSRSEFKAADLPAAKFMEPIRPAVMDYLLSKDR